MRKTVIAFLGFAALTACAQTQQAADDIARRSAKAAVSETLATRVPGVSQDAITPVSDCIIDNASAREIGEFAKDAVIGVSETTVSLIQGVLSRSETQTCVARAGLAALTAA